MQLSKLDLRIYFYNTNCKDTKNHRLNKNKIIKKRDASIKGTSLYQSYFSEILLSIVRSLSNALRSLQFVADLSPPESHHP